MVCLSSVVHHQAKISQESNTVRGQKYVFRLYIAMNESEGMAMDVCDRNYELVNDFVCIMCSEGFACFQILKFCFETLFILVLKYYPHESF